MQFARLTQKKPTRIIAIFIELSQEYRLRLITGVNPRSFIEKIRRRPAICIRIKFLFAFRLAWLTAEAEAPSWMRISISDNRADNPISVFSRVRLFCSLWLMCASWPHSRDNPFWTWTSDVQGCNWSRFFYLNQNRKSHMKNDSNENQWLQMI